MPLLFAIFPVNDGCLLLLHWNFIYILSLFTQLTLFDGIIAQSMTNFAQAAKGFNLTNCSEVISLLQYLINMHQQCNNNYLDLKLSDACYT